MNPTIDRLTYWVMTGVLAGLLVAALEIVTGTTAGRRLAAETEEALRG